MNDEMNEMVEQPLFLVPGSGKEVRLFFNPEKTKLEKIRLSVNKLAELVYNNVLDIESLLHIQSICLITRAKFKTLVKVTPPIEGIQDEAVTVNVDLEETNSVFQEGSKAILARAYVDYYVADDQVISHHDLYNLSVKNQLVLDEIKRRKKNDSSSSAARNRK